MPAELEGGASDSERVEVVENALRRVEVVLADACAAIHCVGSDLAMVVLRWRVVRRDMAGEWMVARVSQEGRASKQAVKSLGNAGNSPIQDAY